MKENIKVGNKFKWKDKTLCQDIFTVVKIEKDVIRYKYDNDSFTYNESIKSFMVDMPTLVESSKDVAISPAHYTTTKISALDVVNDWNLCFYLGNTLKYMKRYKLKGSPITDLEKAVQYLQLKIQLLKDEESK